MRILMYTALVAALFCALTPNTGAELGLARESYGVWDRAGGNSVSEYPFTRGQEYSADWSEINSARSNFNWTDLDNLLQFAYDQNQKFFFKIQPISATDTMPPWMFGTSPDPDVLDGYVPLVRESGVGAKNYDYGYYLDADFKLYFSEMVQDLADHVRNEVAPHLQERIGFVRVDTGTTGDEEPYENGSLVPTQYQISAQDWEDYRLWAFELYRAAFQNGPGPVIPLLFQDIEVSGFPVEWDWVTNNVTGGFGAKYAGLVRGHHLTRSQSVTDDFKAYCVDSDFGLFSRNEMDQTWTKPFFQLNIRLNMYWCAVEQLHPGLSVWDVSQSCLDNSYSDDYTFAFTFFNTWAAELDPLTARGGFCIFHEGLDSSDTFKFPVNPYGSASAGNEARYLAICASNSANGAQMDDVTAATYGQVWQRSNQTGFNDAGWEIVPGNYERFITQIDPGNTSKGLFRINGPLTPSSHPYDRFGRSFDSANGKNTMYFDIHDELLPNPGQRLQLSVIYLDKGTGQFELQYDAEGDSGKTAFVVTKANSNTWKTNSVIVTDWVCANNGPNGADLTLQNVDSDDDIFHMLEVVKLAYVNIGTVGQGSVSARNDFTTWSPVSTTVSEGLRMELTPSPALGWKFSHWSGDLSGTNARPFLYPTEDTRVTAHFAYAGGSGVTSVDDFDSATLTGGTGWSGSWNTSGTAMPTANAGGYTILLQSQGIMTRALATPLTNATLSFNWDIDHLESGEFGVVEVSTNGTTWQQVWSKDLNANGADVQNSPDALLATNINLNAYGRISHIRFYADLGAGDRFWIDGVSVTGSGTATNIQPLFSCDPISETPATVGVTYAATLSDNASDPNSNPITFSKVSGPAWLTVASNGALTGTPSASDSGLNSWIAEVDDSLDGTDEAILLIDVVAAEAGSSYSVWSIQYDLAQGPTGDDDNDGAKNMAEFGLGGNPTNPADLGYLPTFGSASGGGSNWFEYVHVRQTDPNSGLFYYLELTGNLVSNIWTNAGYAVIGSGPFTNGFDAVTNRIDVDGKDRQFIRLMIEQE